MASVSRRARVAPHDDSLSKWLIHDAEKPARVRREKFASAPGRVGGADDDIASGESSRLGQKADAIASYLEKNKDANPIPTGAPVVQDTIRLNLMVLRGPHWCWRNDDGGAGNPGVVLMIDMKNRTATVFWHSTGIVRSCYRFGKFQDLAVMPGAQYSSSEPDAPVATTSSSSVMAPWQRVRNVVASLSVVSAMASAAAKRVTALGHTKAAAEAASATGAKATAEGSTPAEPSTRLRRDSQVLYAQKEQTAIIFDWDDTLFPTTFAFEAADGPKLKVMPMQKQTHLSNPAKTQTGRTLMRCAMRAEQLLRLAGSLGKVVIATLAEPGWIDNVCRYFFPGVAKALEELDVALVYCKSLMENDDEANAPNPDTEEGKVFWSRVKGKAVHQELEKFYSQYEGQTWKNIISLGDADFERLGTRLVAAEYQEVARRESLTKSQESGGVEPPTVINVRTKTFKMIDKPMIDELEAQHNLLLKWLPLIVKVDGHFDASLNDTDDLEEVNAIADELQKRQPREQGCWVAPSKKDPAGASSAVLENVRNGAADKERDQQNLPDVPGSPSREGAADTDEKAKGEAKPSTGDGASEKKE